MEFLIRSKFAVEGFFNQSPATTVLATATFFLFSILFFFLVYWFLNSWHQVSIVKYKDKNIIGGVVPLPAFQVSDSLRKRIEVRAKNDLRLRDFVGDSTNVSWQSFSQDDSISRQFPSQGSHWRDFRDMSVLGLSPKEMVEATFRKYGLLKYKITFYRDNSFNTIFPIRVMQEYFQVQSVEDLQKRMQSGQLSSAEQTLFQSLSAITPEIHARVFRQGAEGQLVWLSEDLIKFATEVEKSVSDKERFRNIFYGEILSNLASPGTKIDFSFDSIPLAPEPMDFLYMSTALATSNLPGEIVPITNDVRAVMWFQLMFSYFVLALNVAALVKWMRLG